MWISPALNIINRYGEYKAGFCAGYKHKLQLAKQQIQFGSLWILLIFDFFGLKYLNL